ncbi:MAG TPA: class I adenylate-forming enzyme family protein [Burkholderiales bacterium]|nr:class I adenylate-forming enzyme family protein [Burkholderiales bacterium]
MTSAAERRRTNLGWFFSDTAARVPGRIALIDHSGSTLREFTYRELDSAAERAGAAFARAGLRPGERIALVAANRAEYLSVFFGAIRAGLVPVPVNHKLGAQAMAFIVEDAACAAVVLDTDSLAGFAPALERCRTPRLRISLGAALQGWAPMSELPGAELEPPELAADAQCFQPYTAGSTGRPKGVIAAHDGQLWSIRMSQRYWPVGEEERGIVAAPLYHKNAMRGTVKPMLYAGASVVLMPGFEPRAYLEAIARHRCSSAFGVPAMFAMLLAEKDLIAQLDFSCLRVVSMGSAPVPQELVERVERAFPSAKVKESYGLTEGGGPLRPPLDGRPVPRGSCGVAAPETELRLIDADGRENPRYGELWIRCPYVCKGYHNQPELTRERLVDGWLRTGDVFSVDDAGFYYFRGRLDDMFPCGGENIYPKDVENLLLAHPDVLDAAVVPHPHRVKGLAPVAMVVPKPGAALDPGALKRFCLERGPAFAHPRIVLVAERLPLSGADKVDRREVRRLFGERFEPIGE